MNFIASDVINKAQLKVSVQKAARQSRTILGEAYCFKNLWSKIPNPPTFIEKMLIRNSNIYYQMHNNLSKICNLSELGAEMSVTEFYAPSYLQSITLSYPEPQFLTLGETVVKTEEPYKQFMVAEHFTNKVYFIASNSLAEGGSLYAADIGKGAEKVVVEKVETHPNKKLTALVVDQITGDIILAARYGKSVIIESLQKAHYLSEIMASMGVSSSIETVEQAD